MSIFNLHFQVLTDYRDLVRSFLTIADERAWQFVEHALGGGLDRLPQQAGATGQFRPDAPLRHAPRLSCWPRSAGRLVRNWGIFSFLEGEKTLLFSSFQGENGGHYEP